MSTLLYRLGRFSFRRWWVVASTWLLVLVALGATIVVGGGIKFETNTEMPGTEAQAGADALNERFPAFAGTGVQVLFKVPEGQKVTDEANKKTIQSVLDAFADVPGVATMSGTAVITPIFGSSASNMISENGQNARTSVQFDKALSGEDATTARQNLTDAAASTKGTDVTVSIGQVGVSVDNLIKIGPTELSGLLIAILVMILAFSSLVAPWAPTITALMGVGMSVAGIIVVALFTQIASFTPTIALMLGLAVGIDYSLFIGTRYRHELARGQSLEEAAGRAIGTAGSAVVFAGATVALALCALSVVGIPMLTAMGVCAGVAVIIAVVGSLTLLPALFHVFGNKLRPKKGGRAYKREVADPEDGHTIGSRWVKIVTKVPVLTVLVVVGIAALMAVPAMKLTYALPDAGTMDKTTIARQTYDEMSEAFGPGYNSPLVVTADIIGTNDPMGVIETLEKDVKSLPGVAAVPVAYPNSNADMVVVMAIPKESGASDATKQLVTAIRDKAPTWEKDLGIKDVMVTGMTAMTIDITNEMSNATVPFGIVVVGLSIILLMIVFRSVLVPIKAALGYLLSVVVAFGAVSLVFHEGHLANLLNVQHVGPVVSFLPIMLMGVLFGLSMDYEMFLVSRMHEEYQHRRDARRAITVGYTSGVRVVAAAAVIMISVFVAFVPAGDAYVPPIAFGLAVGVFFDAFLVRMTLVPAVMKLLGNAAWWLPKWLQRMLPNLDVEGQGLERQLEYEEWAKQNGEASILVNSVQARTLAGNGSRTGVLDGVVRPGSVVALRAPDGERQDLLLALAGRRELAAGNAIVLRHSLADHAGSIRRHTAFVPRFIDAGNESVGAYLDARLLGRSFFATRRRRMARTALGQANSYLAADQIAGMDRSITPAMPVRELSVEDRQLLDVCVAALGRPDCYLIDLGESSGNGGLGRRIGALRDEGAAVVIGLAPDSAIGIESELSYRAAGMPAPAKPAEEVAVEGA